MFLHIHFHLSKILPQIIETQIQSIFGTSEFIAEIS